MCAEEVGIPEEVLYSQREDRKQQMQKKNRE